MVKMSNSYLYLFICFSSSFILLGINAEKRTMECSKVCRALRISGKLGGCNCNYVMFTKRSSEISRSFETEVRDLEQLRQDLTGDAYGDENSEYEELDEKENDRPQSPRNLVDLIRRQVMKPILRDRNY